ncbi:H+ antiporter protein [Nitratireductor aquibiodomus RA22]|uniref:H+ antiporter protein n=1 Tax=Nitratireductor aquibiodomus RA22 TaxID=1189611 RepID=I5BSV9_9HYPH|nr:MFS transporter [Nitratireductor aquibiodomus]EIM72661.1 H+ antiporter protein [Nitratireductor aquibiodomus RA22]
MQRIAIPPARRRLHAVIAAGGLSNLSEGMGGLALLWYVLQSGGGASAVGLLAALSLGAMIVGLPLGGILVDRYGARRIAIAGSVAGTIPVACLALLTGQETVLLSLVFALVLLAELPDGAVLTALEARLPELAAGAGYSLERVNAVDDVIDGISGVAAVPLAGVSVAMFGVSFTLWIALVCGLLATIVAAFSLPAESKEVLPRALAAPFQGFKMIVFERSALPLVLIVALLIAAFNALEEVVVPVVSVEVGFGPEGLGIVMASAGIGALLGATIYIGSIRLAKPRTIFLGAVLVLLASLIAVAVQPNWPVLLGAAFLAGLSAGTISPIVNTRLQRFAPTPLRGRFLGAVGALVVSISPVTALLSGVGVDRFSVELVLIALASLCAACLATAVMFPDAL